MKESAHQWARRGLAFLLSFSMAMGGVPASAYAEALELDSPGDSSIEVEEPKTTETNDTDSAAAAVQESTVTLEEGTSAQEQVSMPAFTGEAQVGNTIVRVEAEEGAFPVGVHLEASAVSAQQEANATEAVADQLEGQSIQDSVVLDVRVVDGSGNEVEPVAGKTVTVSFQTAQIADDSTQTSMFHIEDNGTVEQLAATVKGDMAAAKTSSFSLYVLTFSATVTGGQGGGSESYTGNYSFPDGTDTVTLDAIFTACGIEHYSFSNANITSTGIDWLELSGTGNNMALTTKSTTSASEQATLQVSFRRSSTSLGNRTATITITRAGAGSLEDAVVELEYDATDYDGSEKKPTIKSATYNGLTLVEGTDYELEYTNNLNAGTASVTLKALTSGNYSGQKTVEFVIIPIPVTITGITANDKAYDGKADATLVTDGATYEGAIEADLPYLSLNVTGTFPDAEPDEDKVVTLSAMKLGGDASGNYYIADDSQTTTTATIQKKKITVSGIKAKDKLYNGTAKAALDYSDVAFNGLVGNEKVTVEATGRFPSKEVGNDYTVTISDYVLTDELGHYELDVEGSQKTTTASILGEDLANATVTIADQVYAGEQIKPADADITVKIGETALAKDTDYKVDPEGYGENLNVGPGTVTLIGIAKYAGTSTIGTFKITPKPVKVEGITAETKKYDGSAEATVSVEDATFDGRYDVDADKLGVKATGVFIDADGNESAKINNNTVKLTLELTGDAKDNYVLATDSQKTAPALIEANTDGFDVTIPDQAYTGSQIKPADGDIVVKSGEKTLIKGTDYTISSTGYGTNTDVEDADNNYVTIIGAGGYAGTEAVAKFNITPIEVTVSGIEAVQRAYNGGTDVELNYDNVVIANKVDGDDLGVEATGHFRDKNVKNGKMVVIDSITLTGNDASNYVLAKTGQQDSTEGNIIPATVKVVSGIEAEDKTYDGTTTATLTYDNVTLEGVVDGETVSVTATGTFEDANVGENKNVSITNLALAGDASVIKNYVLADDGNQDATTASITPESILNGLYNGMVDLFYTGEELKQNNLEFTVNGVVLVENKDYTLTYTNNVKPGTAEVEVTGKGNYTGTGHLTFEIKKAQVKVTGITADNKQYDGNTTATLGFDGAKVELVNGGKADEVKDFTVTASGTFKDAAVGDNKVVTISGIAFTGTNAGLYELADGADTVTATANITKREVTYSGIEAEDKVFDNNTDATLDFANLKIHNVVAGEFVDVNREAKGTFDNAEVGNNKKVTIPTLELAGTNAGNYVLATSGNQTTTKASILAKDLPVVTVHNITANNKTYDGAAGAVLNIDNAVIKDANGNTMDPDQYDGLKVIAANGTFVNETGQADPNVGEGKTVAITGIKLSSDKYRIDLEKSDTTTTATIAPAKVTVTAQNASKVFGDPDPVLQVTEEGLIGGDTLTYNKYRDGGDNVGTYAIHLDGVTKQGNYEVTYVEGTFTIVAAAVTVNGIKANNKSYDGTIDATFNYDNVVIEGIAEDADVQVKAEGHFRDKNVKDNKNVPITKITLTGKDAKNYALALTGNQESTTANITPAIVTVSGITAEDKVYDATKNADLVSDASGNIAATLDGVIDGETVYVIAMGEFDSKNVGSNKLVTITNLELAGDADVLKNYKLAENGQQESTTASISAKKVTVKGLVPNDKYYDGTKAATFDVSGATFAEGDIYDGDEVTVASATGTFADPEVGSGKIVTIDQPDGIVLRGADGSNYVPNAASYAIEATHVGSILANTSTLVVENKTKTYGEADPELTWYTDPAIADKLDFELYREDATNNNVGQYAIKVKAVSGKSTLEYDTDEYGNVTATYLKQGGYKILIQAGTLTITAKEVTVTPDAGQTMVYGDTEPTLKATVEGHEGGDNIDYTVTRESGINVGEYAITVGGDEIQGNYKVKYVNDPTVYFTITPRTVTVSGITAKDKIYNKATDATLVLTSAVIDELKNDDAVTVTATGEFEDENAGIAKTVNISDLKLEGDKATNYVLNVDESQATTTATIFRRPVKVTVDAAQSKTYGDKDPVYTATVEEATLDADGNVANDRGLIYGDAVHYDLVRDTGEDVGEHEIKVVGEPIQPNYDVEFVNGTFTINKKKVTIDGITAKDKVYDGNADATLVFNGAQVHDPAFNDQLTVTATGTFASKNVYRKNGEVANKRVDITGLKLEGEKAGNYEIDVDNSQKTASAKITPLGIKVDGITAEDKIYNGLTAATIDFSAATFDALIGSDVVSVESAEGNFEDKNVSRDEDGNVVAKTVNITNVVLTGADGGNYFVDPDDGTQTTAEAKITPKDVIVSGIEAEDKDYDGTKDVKLVVTNATIDGLIADDEGKVIVTDATGEFASANKGEQVQVNLDTITLGPAEGATEDVSGNYNPKGDDLHVPAADINAFAVTVTADAKTKVYDGDDTKPELTATLTDKDGNDLPSDTVAYELTREEGEDVGDYKISFVNPQTTQDGGNYSVTYVTTDADGNDICVSITPRPATVTAKDNTKEYGEADPDPLSEYEYEAEDTEKMTGFLAADTTAADYQFELQREDTNEDAGDYAITFKDHTGTDPEVIKNYEITFVPATFTITTKEITVTADNQLKKYGAQDPKLTVSYDPALVDGDTIEYELYRDKGEDAGQEYAIWFVNPKEYQSGHAGSDAPNYHITFVNGKLGIDHLTVTVTADDIAKQWGDTDPELTATVTGTTKGEGVTYKLEREAGEEVGTYKITPKGKKVQGSYYVKYVEGTFTIDRKEVTVTADDATKTYGEDDPDFTYTIDPKATDLYGEITGLTVEFEREGNQDVGTYAITPKGEAEQGNYKLTFVPGTLTIEPKVVTIDNITAQDKTYDATKAATLVLSDAHVHDVAYDDELTVTATGEFEDKNAGDNKKVTISDLKLNGAKADNYVLDLENSQKSTTASITRREVTITPNDSSKTYGEDDPEFVNDVTVSPELYNGDGPLIYQVNRKAGENAGTYTIGAQGPRVQGNYLVSFGKATFTIEAKTITVDGITAKDKVYDATTDAELVFDNAVVHDPAFKDVLTVTATGTFEDKNVSRDEDGNPIAKVVYITDIKVEGEQAANYVVDATNSQTQTTATITPAELTVSDITASDKEYDGTTTAELDWSGATFQTLFDGDEVEVTDATGNFEDKNVSYDEDGNVASKTVNITNIVLGGTDGGNYDVVPADDIQATASAKITPRFVIVEGIETEDKDYDKTTDAVLKVDNATIKDGVYVDSDGNTVGLVDADKGKVAVVAATGHFNDPDAGKGKSVTIDSITFGPAEGADEDVSGNYVAKLLESHAKEAEIRALPVTVTANDVQKIYGTDDPELTATIDPALLEGDTLTFELTRGEGEDAGEYVITFVNKSIGVPVREGNYDVTYVNGTFTIVSREITVTANNKSKVYGEKDPKLTATISSDEFDPALVDGDKVQYKLKREAGEDAGSYVITVYGDEYQSGHGDDAKNYHITYVNGTFKITTRKITVTADDKSKLYGDPDPVFTVTYSLRSTKATGDAVVAGDTIKYTINRDDDKGEWAGKFAYDIVVSGKTQQAGHKNGATNNYTIKFVKGTLNIKRRKVTVTAKSVTKTFGTKDPAFTAKVKGVIKGDTVTYTFTRKKGEKVGTYTITPTGKAVQGGYEVTYKTGTLTIVDADKLIPEYSAHVEGLGWSHAMYDGEFAGTTGMSKRLEAITIKIPSKPYSGGIQYRTYVTGKGWVGWQKDGAYSGTWGKSTPSTGFQVKLYGELAKHYDVYYRAHVQGYGWLAWAKNGASSGTSKTTRVEAFQVIILKKGSKAPSLNYKGVPVTYNKTFV